MKKVFTIISCLVFSMAVTAQTNNSNADKKTKDANKVTTNSKGASQFVVDVAQNDTPAESLSLKESEYDFGKIPQGKPVTHVFEFTNTGKTPFSIENVQASCGCTTPEWNKDTVPPGGKAKITVGYNAANEGSFIKPVTIIYNGNLTRQIIIKGEVWKTPVTSAPENSAVNSMKNQL